jgi:hypothetical protein
MRAWRRSSKARARDAAYVDASGAGATPNPFAPLAWPPASVDAPAVAGPPVDDRPVEALFVDRAPEAAIHLHEPAPTTPAAGPVAEASAPAVEPVVQPEPPSPSTPPEPQPAVAAPTATASETSPELLRLFEVVTNMCDHVIEYIETDRAERRVMLETLATLGRAIAESAAALAARVASPIEAASTRVTEQPVSRERVIGGSMPAGPEPVIDLRSGRAAAAPAPVTVAVGTASDEPAMPVAGAAAPAAATSPAPATTTTTTVMTTEIAVEVRGRFGDRWVDGFEICEVMETPEGHRYRLRRHRDGVVLPELFDATSIRHVETFDQLATTNGAHVSPGNGHSNGRDANVNDATGYAGPTVNGAPTHWSRS